MSRQDIAKEIDHFQKTDWYRLESTDEIDEETLSNSITNFVQKIQPTPEKKLLEIACGGGIFGLQLVKKVGIDYTGLDLIPELVKDAKKRAKNKGLKAKFINGDAHQLPFPENSFDIVCVTYSLHHFPKVSLDEVTQEVYRVLKKGGKYYALEPNGLNPIMFKWWVLNSPERIFPLGKKWRENRDLSANETIVYPWQITSSFRTKFPKVETYTIGFVPLALPLFKKNKDFWVKVNTQLEKIPLVNKFGGSFVVLGTKL